MQKPVKPYGLVMAITMTTWCALQTTPAFAIDKTYGNALVDKLIHVIDGDTFRVNIDGFPSIIGDDIRVRIADIDTPEIEGQCARERSLAQQARKFAKTILENGRKIELIDLRRPKYFRILATVRVDGIDLGKLLIDRGLARPYFGEKRQGWCTASLIQLPFFQKRQ